MLGWIFRKPILIHNWMPLGIRPPYADNCIYIMKYYVKNGEKIPKKCSEKIMVV